MSFIFLNGAKLGINKSVLTDREKPEDKLCNGDILAEVTQVA